MARRHGRQQVAVLPYSVFVTTSAQSDHGLERISTLSELLREMTGASTPQEAAFTFGVASRRYFPSDGFVSVSRRGLPEGKYKLTRSYLDGRLRTMEFQLTGLDRPDDLPGSLAPAAWFDFLQERTPRRHNADDVLSLVTLAAYLGHVENEERRDGEALGGEESARCARLALAWLEAREEERGRSWVDRALERGAEGALARELRFARALSWKRSKEPERAWDEWSAFLREPSDEFSVPAAIEAAKVLEHDLKERERALEVCTAAREVCEKVQTGAQYARCLRDLERRVERLSRTV